MAKTLFIIGNGFDQFHKIPSSYRNFYDFVRKKFPDKWESLGCLFNRTDPKMLWCDFESSLPRIDVLSCVESNIKTWLDSPCPYYTINNALDKLDTDLRDLFKEWVKIVIQSSVETTLSLPQDALYLNFNYTGILHASYKIPQVNICHIHECPAKEPIQPYFGHGVSKQDIKCEILNIAPKIKNIICKGAFNLTDGAIDRVVSDICSAFEDFINGLHKDTEDRIRISKTDFFSKITEEITNVYVLGHSLSESDENYFKEIKNKINPNAKWNVSYYVSPEQVDNVHQKVANERANVAKRFHEILGNDCCLRLITIDELTNKVSLS